jgi:two-component system, sensor histidine kinase and response regulator
MLPPLQILLVEDNAVNQMLALRLLEKAGHRVTVAWNGREAVTTAASGEFDLVLMDVQMPEMDGLEATAAIRQNEQGKERRLPIVALTANALVGDREMCLRAGMDGYVTKPVRAPALFRAMADALGLAGQNA